jgi:putative ABC transport system permease protein
MMRLAWRLALRDLRGGLGGLLIVLLCLSVGVAAVAGIFSLRAALDQGIAESSRTILGGDIEVSSGLGPISPAMVEWFTARGARLSETIETRSMLVSPSGRRLLAAVSAVGPGWPLLGAVSTRPAGQFAGLARETNGRAGLLLAPEAAQTLGLHPGDAVTLGGVPLLYSGSILKAPDSIGDSQLFGAKCFVASAALAGTPLVQPGALVMFNMQVLLPAAASIAATEAAFTKAFPNADFQLRDRTNAAPDLTRFIGQAALFMTLLALSSLLVGGIGVANGVEAWLTARARTIATLRCLGASARLVGLMQGMQLLVLGLPGIVLGLAAGAGAPLLVLPLLRNKLPLPAHIGLYPQALLISGVFGVLTGFLFAFRPLRRAAAISGAALFRPAGLPAKIGFSATATAVQAIAGLALVALAVWVVPSFYIALGFCAGTLVTLALLRAIAAVLMRVMPLLPSPKDAAIAFGLRRLSGPASSLPLMLLSAGAGLTVLVAVAEIRGNLVGEFTGALPAQAPSFFFIDLQPADLPAFQAVLARTGAAHDLQALPSLRARITAIGNIPAEPFHPKHSQSGWPLGTDIGFSYAATPPPGTKLQAGAWWAADYLGPPLLSFDAKIAQDWGLKVGDKLTVNVLGRSFTLQIANLRNIDWQSLQLNFLMVGTPDPFAGAPHTLVATARVDPGQEGAVLTAIGNEFPGVTAIDIGAVLRALGGVLGEVGTAVDWVGLIALLAGGLVLISAIAAERQARIAEAVVLKTLGASTAQIRRAWIAEFAIAGGAAGISAALLGTLAAFITVRQVFDLDWHFQPGIMLATLLGSITLMLVLGFATTSRILRLPAAPQLRLESGA